METGAASSQATLEIAGQDRVCGAWLGLLPAYVSPESQGSPCRGQAQSQSDGLRTVTVCQ